MTYIEEADFQVQAVLTISFGFSPIERDTPLTKEDAIANAYGTVSKDVWKALKDEGWSIEFSAKRWG